MKPVKILALLLAAVMALSACTSAPPVQETPPVTESTSPSTEPVTEPPPEPPTTSPPEPTTDFTGVPYTSAQKSYYDDLRLPFDEALTFYIQVPEIPAKMKFSIAPSGTEDWTELTCTGECFAIDPHHCTYRQYQIPYNAKGETLTASWRLKMEVDMEDAWNHSIGAEYRCDVFDDIHIQDDSSVLIYRSSADGENGWVTDSMDKNFCIYCYDRFGLPTDFMDPETRPPVTSSSGPNHDWTGRGHPYKPEERAYYDSLRLPFDEALTFYIESPGGPVVWKYSIAPSGTEDWTELTCTGDCGAIDPHSPRSYGQYQAPYKIPDDRVGRPYRVMIEVDPDNEWNIQRGFEYKCEILEDIVITDDLTLLTLRYTSYNERVWVTDDMRKLFCDYCYDRFGITDPPKRYTA